MSVKLLGVLYKDCQTIAETFGDLDPRVLKVSEISWCHMSRSTFRRLSNKSFGGEYLKCFGNVTCLAQTFGNLDMSHVTLKLSENTKNSCFGLKIIFAQIQQHKDAS